MGLRWHHVGLLVGLVFATAVLDAMMLALLVPIVQGVSGSGFSFLTGMPLLGHMANWDGYAGPFLMLSTRSETPIIILHRQ